MTTERELTLTPDGVTPEAFRQAIARFEAVLGPDNVLTGTDRLPEEHPAASFRGAFVGNGV